MFGIGGFELFIILVFGFLIFGPDKLPEIAKTVGKGIARFREAQQEVNDTLGGEKIFDPDDPDEPFKNPVEVLDRVAQRQEEKKAGKAGGSKPAARSVAKGSGAKPSAAKASAEAATEEGAGAEQPTAEQPADASGQLQQPRQESFTERKARYERERAARKAAEAAEAAGAESTGARGGDAGQAGNAAPEGGDA